MFLNVTNARGDFYRISVFPIRVSNIPDLGLGLFYPANDDVFFTSSRRRVSAVTGGRLGQIAGRGISLVSRNSFVPSIDY